MWSTPSWLSRLLSFRKFMQPQNNPSHFPSFPPRLPKSKHGAQQTRFLNPEDTQSRSNSRQHQEFPNPDSTALANGRLCSLDDLTTHTPGSEISGQCVIRKSSAAYGLQCGAISLSISPLKLLKQTNDMATI